MLALPDALHPEAPAAPRCIWCELFSKHSCASLRSPVFFPTMYTVQQSVLHQKHKNTRKNQEQTVS